MPHDEKILMINLMIQLVWLHKCYLSKWMQFISSPFNIILQLLPLSNDCFWERVLVGPKCIMWHCDISAPGGWGDPGKCYPPAKHQIVWIVTECVSMLVLAFSSNQHWAQVQWKWISSGLKINNLHFIILCRRKRLLYTNNHTQHLWVSGCKILSVDKNSCKEVLCIQKTWTE